jgi:hypothetical protein
VRLVRAVFPDHAAALLAAGADLPPDERESERVAALVARAGELFPLYEVDCYELVTGGIPLYCQGWDYDDLHELQAYRPGRLLMLALVEGPFDAWETGWRAALLDALEAILPPAVLDRLPPIGLGRETLGLRLAETPYAAAADFAAWLWAETGTVFLDVPEGADVVDADWSPEVVADVADQWRRARALLDRIEALERWLEADPAPRFGALLDAAGVPPRTRDGDMMCSKDEED